MMTRITTLEYYHDLYNKEVFNGKLATPKFGLTRSKATDGYYDHYPRRNKKGKIAIAERLFDDEDQLMGTMLHEMIHQYQHEILEVKTLHDATFRSIARKLERKYKLSIR